MYTSRFNLAFGSPVRTCWISRVTVEKIQQLPVTSLSIDIEGPKNGKYRVCLSDVRNPNKKNEVMGVSFVFDSEDEAETAFKELLTKVKSLSI